MIYYDFVTHMLPLCRLAFQSLGSRLALVGCTEHTANLETWTLQAMEGWSSLQTVSRFRANGRFSDLQKSIQQMESSTMLTLLEPCNKLCHQAYDTMQTAQHITLTKMRKNHKVAKNFIKNLPIIIYDVYIVR